jgi:tripartite motif-containing protein 71
MSRITDACLKACSTGFALALFVSLLVASLFIFGSGLALAVTAIPAPSPILQLGGTGNGYFGRTTGIALDSGGNIYVSDLENGRVQEFDSHGNFLKQLTPPIDPLALTIAGNTLYVGGEQNGNSSNTLVEFDLTTGNFIQGWGSGTVFLSVAVDPSGNVYAVENSHGNIIKFAPDGTLLNSQFGGISGHEAVATDGSFIYVTSNLPSGGQTTYPLQKYDFNGNLIAQWGTASQFSDGVGLAVDSSGNFHVSNQATHQVFTFQVSGTNTLTLLYQAGGIGQGNGQFYYPYGIATDSAGNTYVADDHNSRVQILNTQLNFVSAFGNSTLYGGFNNNLVGLFGTTILPQRQTLIPEWPGTPILSTASRRITPETSRDRRLKVKLPRR